MASNSGNRNPERVIKQSVLVGTVEYNVKLKEAAIIDGKKHFLVHSEPYYAPTDYCATEGRNIPIKPRNLDYKTLDELVATAEESKKNGTNYKYKCQYCGDMISQRKDSADRHVDGRKGVKTYVCSARKEVEPDLSKKAKKRPQKYFFEIVDEDEDEEE